MKFLLLIHCMDGKTHVKAEHQTPLDTLHALIEYGHAEDSIILEIKAEDKEVYELLEKVGKEDEGFTDMQLRGEKSRRK
jgi:hypothetical protein